MTYIWAGMLAAAVLCGALSGKGPEVGAAATAGAAAAVQFCLGAGALICLWSGVMEVMSASGLTALLEKALRPVLGRLFPNAFRDSDTAGALCSNISANLLGLGNAATPMGIRAACNMARLPGGGASDELCRLVVLNTASIQLLPTTVASLRASMGSSAPFDILPAVWLSSLCSVSAGLFSAFLLSRLWKR